MAFTLLFLPALVGGVALLIGVVVYAVMKQNND